MIRAHPGVVDRAVVGLPDPVWGERIGAAIELLAGSALSLEDLRWWMKDRVAPYRVPTHLRCVPALPRNAMGKVLKPDVATLRS